MIKRTTSILALAVAALAFTGVTGVASAQSSGQSANQQKAQQMMQQYRQKANKLQKIHRKTINSNPDLAKEQQQFEKQVRQAVEAQGYDIDKGRQRMQKMGKKLQSGDLSDAEKKATMKDFRAERQQMSQARDAALKKPAIQKAGKKLQADTLAAMKKQNSETSQLLDDMQSLRSKLRKQMPSPAAGDNNG